MLDAPFAQIPTELVRSRILTMRALKLYCCIASWNKRDTSYAELRDWGVGAPATVSKAIQELLSLGLIGASRGFAIGKIRRKSKYWVMPRSKWQLRESHLNLIRKAVHNSPLLSRFNSCSDTDSISESNSIQKMNTINKVNKSKIKKKKGAASSERFLGEKDLKESIQGSLSGGRYLQEIPALARTASSRFGNKSKSSFLEVITSSQMFFNSPNSNKGDRIIGKLIREVHAAFNPKAEVGADNRLKGVEIVGADKK